MQTRFRFRVLSAFGAFVTALLLVVPSLGAQQGGTITGRVNDASSGQPLAAVQVFISALDLGGLTQQNGRYLLQNVPAGTHTLAVSRIGYRTIEAQVTVGGGQTVEQNFSVSEEALQLDEIIVTGTAGGTQRRAIGNAVTTVDAAAITAQVPITTMQQMLSARTPGLNFTRAAGGIGVGSAINIRGFSSILIGNQPLIYVDGIRVDNSFSQGPENFNSLFSVRDAGGMGSSALDDINPEDIESIEVIKGPAAATLYGSEASAGVIQIITKRGSVGAPEFSLTVRQGQNYLANPSAVIGNQFGCRAGPPAPPLFGVPNATPETGQSLRPCHPDDIIKFNIYDYHAGKITNRNPDHVSPNSPRDIFSTGYSQQYNLGVRGGTEQVRYFVAADYLDNTGVVSFNTQDRLNLRTNIDVIFSDNISISFNGSYQEGETRFNQGEIVSGGDWQELVGAQANHLVGATLNTPDTVNLGCIDRYTGNDADPFPGNTPEVCNPAHQPLGLPGDADGFANRDPSHYATVESIRDFQRFTGSLTATHTAGTWLTQRLIVGFDNSWTNNSNLTPRGRIVRGNGDSNSPSSTENTPDFPFFFTSDGRIQVSRPVISRFSFDYSASGTYEPNSTLQFVTSAGVQFNRFEQNTLLQVGNVLPTAALNTLNNAQEFETPEHQFAEERSLGFYIQEQVGINGRLFFTGAVRADDNSAFGDSFERKYYPKGSATWTISEENFWNFDFINSMRVRTAIGQAGRQPGPFARLQQYTNATGPGVTPALRLISGGGGNVNIGAEESTEWEGGIDIAFADDRVFGEFTYFKQWINDAIVRQQTASSEAYRGNVQVNVGALENWGWEMALDVTLFESDNFGANLRISGDHTSNRLTRLNEDQASSGENFREGYFYPNVASTLLDSAHFTEYVVNPSDPTDSIFDLEGDIDAWCDFGDPLTPFGLTRGGPSVPCDVSDDADHVMFLGSSFPTYTWSLAPTLRFLQNQLEVFGLFEGQYGRWLACLDCGSRSGTTGTQNARLGWTQEDPVYQAAQSFNDDRWQGRFKADFWKLREIGARYQLPQSLAGSIGMDRASLAISANNLWTVWRRQWKDRSGTRIPDVETTAEFSAEPNFSSGNFPSLSSWSIVLRASF